jgi:cysteinyl-tRNA synthetase
MTLKLTNSLTGKKEEFVPLVPGEVRMYNCGPTVYNYAHVGNLRAFLTADVLRRLLEARGFAVRQVMNITDVGHMTLDDIRDAGEDKMAVAARRLGKDPWQVAAFYTKAFHEDLKVLNFLVAESYPRATESIPEMIAMVERLIEGGHAYVVGGNVYFDVSTFPEYGKLSGNTVESLKAGARLEVNPEKRHPADFALWKSGPNHIMQWESPWGSGFPGWHIECSVMAQAALGEQIDIHTGGEDNRFPHHECEIAQSEAATGKEFARTWIHTGYLRVGGEKMSKSKGNFFTLRDLLENGFDPMAIRSALISVHYRQPMNLTLESIEEAAKNRKRVQELLRKIGGDESVGDRPEVAEVVAAARAEFDASMDDDLNISPARAAVLGLVSDVNRAGLPLSPADADQVRAALTHFDGILGIGLLRIAEEEDLSAEIEALIKARNEARGNRDFAESDRIRDELLGRGILLEDGAGGTTWRRV